MLPKVSGNSPSTLCRLLIEFVLVIGFYQQVWTLVWSFRWWLSKLFAMFAMIISNQYSVCFSILLLLIKTNMIEFMKMMTMMMMRMIMMGATTYSPYCCQRGTVHNHDHLPHHPHHHILVTCSPSCCQRGTAPSKLPWRRACACNCLILSSSSSSWYDIISWRRACTSSCLHFIIIMVICACI